MGKKKLLGTAVPKGGKMLETASKTGKLIATAVPMTLEAGSDFFGKSSRPMALGKKTKGRFPGLWSPK